MRGALEPSDFESVDHDDANLGQLPLFGKLHFVRDGVEAQGLKDPLIFGEVEAFAEGVIRRNGGAQADVHFSAR